MSSTGSHYARSGLFENLLVVSLHKNLLLSLYMVHIFSYFIPGVSRNVTIFKLNFVAGKILITMVTFISFWRSVQKNDTCSVSSCGLGKKIDNSLLWEVDFS